MTEDRGQKAEVRGQKPDLELWMTHRNEKSTNHQFFGYDLLIENLLRYSKVWISNYISINL